jgi:hypothetical protein
MATDFLPKIVEGPISTEAVVVPRVAAGAIEMWAPVILSAPGTGEDIARVDNVAGITNKVFGVVVGPLKASGKAADAAGDKVDVVTYGPCKIRVDGNAANIAVNDALISHASGYAQKVAATGFPFALAEHTSTVDGDVIPGRAESRGYRLSICFGRAHKHCRRRCNSWIRRLAQHRNGLGG